MKVSFVAVLLAPCLAFAADLKPAQEEEKAAFDKQWKPILEEINTACGTKFDVVQTDFENWDKKNFVRTRAGTVCSTLAYALKQTCKSEPYKKAVAAKLKGLACRFTGAKKDSKDEKTNFEFPGGVFTQHLDQDHTGSSVAVAVLKEELDK